MVRIAIVEDELKYSCALEDYINRYSNEKNLLTKIKVYSNAVALLENYTAEYDIIFMDIRMPYMNGMDAAYKLRELDKKVLLVFVSGLTQYAIKGYEVEALDYLVKPISYYDFSLKMSRAIQKLPQNVNSEIIISTINGIAKLSPNDIRFLETDGHHVIYHTAKEDFIQYATLSSAEKKLRSFDFARCNNCYLVNLQFVQRIKGYFVTVDGKDLQISQPRKKAFVQQLIAYSERKTL